MPASATPLSVTLERGTAAILAMPGRTTLRC